MVTKELSEAAVEFNCILSNASPEIIKKIPKSFINFMKDIASTTYKFDYDKSKKLNEQTLKLETRGLISLVYSDYICNDKEKEEYIGSIENKLDRYESYYNTGNAFIDSILHRKKMDAIEQGIELKILADLRPFANMKNEDLCVVISNILDNALRECELRKKEEPGKENLIQLRAGKFRGFLSIVCENSIRKNQAKYVVSSREIQTTKPDKSRHGYGIKNVKNIVRKYGGEYSIQVRDGMFCFSIIVPL